MNEEEIVDEFKRFLESVSAEDFAEAELEEDAEELAERRGRGRVVASLRVADGDRGDERDPVEEPVQHHAGVDAVRPGAQPRERAAEDEQLRERLERGRGRARTRRRPRRSRSRRRTARAARSRGRGTSAPRRSARRSRSRRSSPRRRRRGSAPSRSGSGPARGRRGGSGRGPRPRSRPRPGSSGIRMQRRAATRSAGAARAGSRRKPAIASTTEEQDRVGDRRRRGGRVLVEHVPVGRARREPARRTRAAIRIRRRAPTTRSDAHGSPRRACRSSRLR